MNTITGFEAGITRLQNPSFLTRLLGELSEFSRLNSFWTWGALILAAVATFSSILHQAKTHLLRFRTRSSTISDPLIRFDNDPDDETSSISSGSDSDDSVSAFESELFLGDRDFSISGRRKSDTIRWRNRKLKQSEEEEEDEQGLDECGGFSGSVVKLWNEIGFGFGSDNPTGLISMWDLNKGQILRSFLAGKGQIPALLMASPAVVVSAGVENMRHAAMKIWDARVGSEIPSAVVEWQPRRRGVVDIDSGGVGPQVYLREDKGSSVVVRDMRNVGSPLAELADSDGQTWFDADAVMVADREAEGDELDGVLTEKGWGPSVVTRCRKAMRSYLF